MNARRITTAQLLNLADRTPHGLTPDETTRLRQGVAHQCARADYLTGYAATLETYAAEQRERAEKAEAAIERVRAELADCDDDHWMVQAGDIRAALAEHQEQPPTTGVES